MKSKLIIIAALLLPLAAHADQTNTSSTQSNARTSSNAGSTANPYTNVAIESHGYKDSTVRGNPAIGIPSGASAFSPFNCANVGSAGGSGALIALGGSVPVESDQCNGRADATIWMQMANATRTIDADMANKFVRIAIGIMCDQSDKSRAKGELQGVCDHADYPGNKREYHVYTSGARQDVSFTGGQ